MAILTDMLKVLTGRKLSKRAMKRAETEKPADFIYEDGRTFDNLYRRGDKIFRKTIRYSWRVTRDASEGERILHEGYYPVKDEERTYNSQGLLETKELYFSPTGEFVEFHKTIAYEPAGRFIGKRVR